MNVNSLGAKPIYRTDVAATRVTTQFAKNVTWLFIYNESRVTGGCWDLAYLYNTNSTYAGYSFGLGYGVCDTAEATIAKTCAISSYSLSNGGVVSVKFTNTVCANATLNINSKGAKPIYFRGAPIIKEIIRAGDIATFQYYGGYYYLISIDRLGELTNSVSKGAVEGSTILGYSAEEDGDGYHPNIALEQFSLAHGGALGFPIKITGAANTTTYTYSKSDPDMLEITTKNIDTYLTLSLGYSYLANGTSDDDNVIRSKILSVDTDNATITIQSAVSDTALNSATWYLLVPSIASAHASTSGGAGTIASENSSAAIGQGTMAISDGSFAEGFATIAGSESNNNAHAEGCASIASGYASHAEGITTEATGFMSHSEGWLTVASGTVSHSEGKETNASGYASHTEGTGTIANRANQHASGSYNISDAVGSASVRGTYIEIVGNGTSANARSNARTLDWNGNEWVAGKVSAGTVASPASVVNANDLTTKKYVDDAISDASGGLNLEITNENLLFDSSVTPVPDTAAREATYEAKVNTYLYNYPLTIDGIKGSYTSGTVIKGYQVTAGQILYLDIDKVNATTYQFQSNSSIPSSGTNSYLVGNVVTTAVHDYVEVPQNASWLFVSTTTNITSKQSVKFTRLKYEALDSVSKITLPDSSQYDVKDSFARQTMLFGYVNSDYSTSAIAVAHVPGLTELRHGTTCLIYNPTNYNFATYKLNVNSLGAKPVQFNGHFNNGSFKMFVYDEFYQDEGMGGWRTLGMRYSNTVNSTYGEVPTSYAVSSYVLSMLSSYAPDGGSCYSIYISAHSGVWSSTINDYLYEIVDQPCWLRINQSYSDESECDYILPPNIYVWPVYTYDENSVSGFENDEIIAYSQMFHNGYYEFHFKYEHEEYYAWDIKWYFRPLSVDGTEMIVNKVTSLSASSTDTQYPSAKCVYDIVGNIEAALAALR